MSNFYAYDGTTWRDTDELWVYDGATWRDVQTGYVYDGATWRKVFEAVSCINPTCDSGTSVWTEESCTQANECQYCIGVNTTNCTDVCHNIDGFRSISGGSFTGTSTCANKGCTDQSGNGCSAEMDCNLYRGGAGCATDGGTTVQGRVTVEDDSDGTDRCSYTGSTHSGPCLA